MNKKRLKNILPNLVMIVIIIVAFYIYRKYDYNYLFLGSGDKVIDQSPAKGTKIKQGGIIILYLG